mmetsp:Transcript_42301/g.100462  ORF Transcript_42301/g.100462 Transcript_42301/m.100462 type:complete len:522 (+) Transcript_42301:128-1693(+)
MSSPLRTPQHGRPGSITRASSSKSNKPPTYSSSATKENRPDGGMHLHHSAVMMSPGADMNMFLSPGMPHMAPPSGDKKRSAATNSPFREWATSQLGCLGDEIDSPGQAIAASQSILSPGYGDMPVKIEGSPSPAVAGRAHSLQLSSCKPTTLEHNLAEAAAHGPFLAGFEPGMDTVVVKLEARHAGHGASPYVGKPRRRPVNIGWSEFWAFELSSDGVAHSTTPQLDEEAASSRQKRAPSFPPAFNPVTPAAALPPAMGHDASLSNPYGGLAGVEGQGFPGEGEGSADRKRVCSCKKSKCLKLYCECFSAGVLCDGCKCADCANDGEHEGERLAAVEAIKSRNPVAFAPKILDEVQQDKGHHARGCRCKKSHCLKKYCECYQAGIKCGDKCKCEECHNIPRDGGGDQAGVTPRERAEALASHSSHGSSGKSSAGSSAVRPRALLDNALLSPPRNKKPRVLDFDVFSTPAGAPSLLARPGDSPAGAASSVDAEAPAPTRTDQLLAAAGSLFDSPCSSFLAVP